MFHIKENIVCYSNLWEFSLKYKSDFCVYSADVFRNPFNHSITIFIFYTLDFIQLFSRANIFLSFYLAGKFDIDGLHSRNT